VNKHTFYTHTFRFGHFEEITYVDRSGELNSAEGGSNDLPSSSFLVLGRGFPILNGMYRYLIMCMIWRFIVRKVSTKKYITSIGQKTGTSKISKNVRENASNVDFIVLSQNLNSGKRRINGRNSSLLLRGREGPSSSSLSISNAGSIFGVKNERNMFR